MSVKEICEIGKSVNKMVVNCYKVLIEIAEQKRTSNSSQHSQKHYFTFDFSPLKKSILLFPFCVRLKVFRGSINKHKKKPKHIYTHTQLYIIILQHNKTYFCSRDEYAKAHNSSSST